MENKCLVCGAIIPEGRQVCLTCKKGGKHEISKKLTDEEIIKAYFEDCNEEFCFNCPLGETDCCAEILDLIHRLQSENESLKKQIDELPKPRKKILANKVYSDSTLKKWSKEDLIEHIRILEHNWSCAEENLNNSVKNSEKIFYEQKAEIERLTEENEYVDMVAKQALTDCEKLQIQVDELEKLNAKYLDSIESVQAGRCRFRCELTQQAVKDTAKEIFENLLGYIGSQQQFCIVDEEHKTLIDCDKLFDFVGNLAKERYGVEVE